MRRGITCDTYRLIACVRGCERKMNLKDFVKEKKFSTGSGLPEGDTVIDLVSTQVEEFKNDEGKVSYKLTLNSGVVFYVPKTVMKKTQELSGKGFSVVRVTRSGLTLNDTSYTVVGIEQQAKQEASQ